MKKILIYIMVCIGVLSCHTSNITKEPVNNNDDNLFTDTKNINNESDDYYKPQRLKFTDEIYSDNIKSVQLFSADWVFGPPIIWTEKQNKLTLYFDELNSNKKDYYFSFIYCDAMWNPLDVPTMDYLEGFNEDPITSYQSSMNTLVSYIHYAVDFPSENMKPKKSGNYLLHVYYYN